ncbi:MAG: DUF4153 domain-containing protein [Bacteroidota bacterium]
MKNSSIILSLALVFHLLFWEAGLGLNVVLFSLAASGAATWLKPEESSRPMVRALLAGWCLSAFFVFLHHSDLSMLVYWVFLFTLIGYLQATEVRFWLAGLMESIRGLFAGWIISVRNLGETSSENSTNWKNTWRQVRLWFLPIAIIVPFYIIYSNANSTLGSINSKLDEWLGQLFQFDLHWGRFFIFLLGWVLVVALLGQRSGIPALHNLFKDWQFPLVRKRKPVYWNTSTIGLKYEYQMATYTFLALNGLLLFVNTLDFIFVWFSPQERTAAELSQYVHQGTWLLIFSIVLAMLVVVFFLRNNLNFYPRNERLKQHALIWLAQNAFLALSVGMRNGHYISQYGLAHGRIVVIFFLLLVLYGLYTMYHKIEGPQSTFFLLEMNGRAMLAALLIAAAFNWDSLITRYNLQQDKPDTYHATVLLSNNMVPILKAAQKSDVFDSEVSEERIQIRGSRLEKKVEQQDWRSWNWSTYRQLKAWQAYQNVN